MEGSGPRSVAVVWYARVEIVVVMVVSVVVVVFECTLCAGHVLSSSEWEVVPGRMLSYTLSARSSVDSGVLF